MAACTVPIGSQIVIEEALYKQADDQVTAVDLFCGAGGLTNGLMQAGIHVKAGIDLDETCKYAYEENNPGTTFIADSVSNINPEDISEYLDLGKYSLLCGCAPCQTFSTYNQKASEKDHRWWLLNEFGRLIKELLPDYVTMENVPGLVGQNVFDSFLETLKSKGYFFTYSIVDCPDYGIPQKRKRLVLLASLHSDISLLPPEQLGIKKRKTVRDAIGHLNDLPVNSSSNKDILHRSQRLSNTNLKRIKNSRPDGTWKDWDESLLCPCHKRENGKTYSSVYGRMSWDSQSPTITTQFYNYGSGRFGHPTQNRALSLREGALLQTFPASYKFIDPERSSSASIKDIGRLIGNAVPPQLGYVIGATIKEHINGRNRTAKPVHV